MGEENGHRSTSMDQVDYFLARRYLTDRLSTFCPPDPRAPGLRERTLTIPDKLYREHNDGTSPPDPKRPRLTIDAYRRIIGWMPEQFTSRDLRLCLKDLTGSDSFTSQRVRARMQRLERAGVIERVEQDVWGDGPRPPGLWRATGC